MLALSAVTPVFPSPSRLLIGLWAAGDGDHSYTSIQRATFGGVEQLLALTSAGLIAFDPSDGAILWMDP